MSTLPQSLLNQQTEGSCHVLGPGLLGAGERAGVPSDSVRSVPAFSLQPSARRKGSLSHFSSCLHHRPWHRARHRGSTAKSKSLLGITPSLNPVRRGHTAHCLMGPLLSHSPQTTFRLLVFAWIGCLMTLSGRVCWRASVTAEQENKNPNCQLPFWGPWRGVATQQRNEET